MKSKSLLLTVTIFFMWNSAHADIEINSPNGNSTIFSQARYGDNVEPDAWGKLLFNNSGIKIDISRLDRYYIEDGSSKVSPSGNYLVVNSISGNVLDSGNGQKQYVSKAYCSVIDMRNGCIVSDWDGEACGYQWAKNKDTLTSSDYSDADTFDFLSMKPSMDKLKGNYSALGVSDVNNMMRCDVIGNENIDAYQKLSKENSRVRKIVQENIVNYIDKLESTTSVKSSKSSLYSSPDEKSVTKDYLVMGDKTKIIKISEDKTWTEIGYVNPKGKPLVAWVKSDSLN